MIAIVRVRGTVNVKPDIKMTMQMLRLFSPNNMVIVPDSQAKMVEKIKDYVTYGNISEDVFAKVLEKRGRIGGGKKLSQEALKAMNVSNFSELAKNILTGKSSLKGFGIQPVFRLHPPRKGYDRKGIKMPFALGGALGNRKEEISGLVLRMI